jgi:hypothetical protein
MQNPGESCQEYRIYQLTFNPLISSDLLINKNHHVFVKSSTTNHNFVVNATIVDLDLKKDSLNHFRKYKKQYHESKCVYLDFMKEQQD